MISILLMLKSRSRTESRQTINHQFKSNRFDITKVTDISFLIWDDKTLLEAVKVCRINSLWLVWWVSILHDSRDEHQFFTIRMMSIDASSISRARDDIVNVAMHSFIKSTYYSHVKWTSSERVASYQFSWSSSILSRSFKRSQRLQSLQLFLSIQNDRTMNI